MTREEIEELKGLAVGMGLYDDKNPCKRAVILGKAIKALEQQPCENAVSRRKVFSAIHNTHLPKKYEEPLWNKVSDLPSVTPIRPKGEWIEIVDEETAFGKTWHYECSKCGKYNTCLDGNPDFCPGCGADMRGYKNENKEL